MSSGSAVRTAGAIESYLLELCVGNELANGLVREDAVESHAAVAAAGTQQRERHLLSIMRLARRLCFIVVCSCRVSEERVLVPYCRNGAPVFCSSFATVHAAHLQHTVTKTLLQSAVKERRVRAPFLRSLRFYAPAPGAALSRRLQERCHQ